jgi:hypothetical protein
MQKMKIITHFEHKADQSSSFSHDMAPASSVNFGVEFNEAMKQCCDPIQKHKFCVLPYLLILLYNFTNSNNKNTFAQNKFYIHPWAFRVLTTTTEASCFYEVGFLAW